MASFRFEAADAAGKLESGVLEADGARAARAQLRARGLVPLAVQPVAELGGEKSARRRLRVQGVELTLFTRQLATLLSAKLPLAVALAAAVEQAERQPLRDMLSSVRSDVMAGARFADALARFPRNFPRVYVATVAAGEESGDLALVLERLADHLEQRQSLRSKVLAAFLYPSVITVVAFAIVLFLMGYVVPQVVQVFEQTRQTLPWLTRALLWASRLLQVAGPWLVIVLPLLFYASRAWLRRPRPKAALQGALLRLPFVGRLVRAIETARFSATLAVLCGAGVPVLRALEGARATLTNLVMAQAASEALSQVREGSGLAPALRATKVFPPVLIHLIASGEATGQLAPMLDRAAQIQAREVERRVLVLTTLLEPLLILVMGAVVLAIVLAVLMPIIEMNQLVR